MVRTAFLASKKRLGLDERGEDVFWNAGFGDKVC